jgi:Pyruvate/2-oxoacid:ferredoxin oxidoreductase delta subunit
MYCPEADCIKLDTRKMKAYVVVERCKGCELVSSYATRPSMKPS